MDNDIFVGEKGVVGNCAEQFFLITFGLFSFCVCLFVCLFFICESFVLCCVLVFEMMKIKRY